MFNKNLLKIQPSASMKAGLAEQDKPITNLAVGIPDLVPPREIVDIIHQGADAFRFNYVPSKGTKKALLNLKQLLFASEDAIDPEVNLQLVSGAKYGIYLSLKTVCNEGDTVLLMQPYWLSYPEIIHSLGLHFKSWDPVVDEKGNLDFDLQEFERLVKQHNVKAIIFNNPNNPAGKVFDKEWVQQLNTILKRNDGWLLIDEVYRDLVFDTTKAGEFAITDTNIIRIGSLSKSLSIPGLRLGYICGPAAMISNADLFNQHIQTCINSLSCHLIENLDNNVFQAFAAKCAATYKERYELIAGAFANSKLKVLHSEASFYSMVDFRHYFRNGQEACDYLSSKLNIIAVPGLPYGPDFETYIRICLTLPSEVLSGVFDQILNNLPDERI